MRDIVSYLNYFAVIAISQTCIVADADPTPARGRRRQSAGYAIADPIIARMEASLLR